MKSVKRNLKRGYTRIGLLFAIPLALLSLTPSLLPRTWFFQGLLTGLAMIFGYAVGNVFGATYRFFEIPELPKKIKKNIITGALVTYSILAIYLIVSYTSWDNTVRELVGLEKNSSLHLIRIILMTTIVAYLILIVARFVRGFVRKFIRFFSKYVPSRLGRVIGVLGGTLLLILLLNGVLLRGLTSLANSAYSTTDGTTDEGVVQPTIETRSGGPNSLVEWDTLGRQGRKFTGTGPTKDELNSFSGGGAKDPIRVYVGLKSADNVESRAELALEELKRTGAFEREVLVVTTTTGTGWLDPGAVDSVEYVNNGDTAIVGLQYSYLPSAISLFVDQQITLDTARETLEKVHGYWSGLDEDSRPELYVFGLSLGSFGSQSSAQDLRLVNDPIDGALWAGSPFFTEEWSTLTNSRDDDSPAWQPVVDEGRVVRFTGEENALNKPTAEWGDVKYAYLQHATDPVVFFSLGLLFNSPEWLNEGERGPDITPDMTWIPGVTFFQVAADLPAGGTVPNGHGHAYSFNSYANVWAAITEPDGWNDEKTAKLQEFYSKE